MPKISAITQTGLSPLEAPNCRWGGLNVGAVAENWWLSTCQLASLSHWASTFLVCSMFAVMDCVVNDS